MFGNLDLFNGTKLYSLYYANGHYHKVLLIKFVTSIFSQMGIFIVD